MFLNAAGVSWISEVMLPRVNKSIWTSWFELGFSVLGSSCLYKDTTGFWPPATETNYRVTRAPWARTWPHEFNNRNRVDFIKLDLHVNSEQRQQQGKSADWGLKCTEFSGGDGIYDVSIVNQKPCEVGGNKRLLLRPISFFSSDIQSSLQYDIFGQMAVGAGLIWNPCTKLLYVAWISKTPYQEYR